jgi:GR25 family glycosyltransferase involved in LPS biosynthesis
MKVIVNSLIEASERRKFMTDVLGNQNIDFDWNDSISYKDMNIDFKLTTISSPQAIANFETHRNAIKMSKSELSIILEDDATPIPNVMKILDDLIKKSNMDFDILFCGWTSGFFTKLKQVDESFVWMNRFWGTHSYIVNPNSVDKVLSVLGKPNNHIDKRMSDLVNSGKIKGIFTKQKIFSQNKSFKTQIPKK